MNSSILLGKTAAEPMNFIFGIGSTLFIGTVDLTMPIEVIVFHIVKVNTFFLLCLTDLDKVKAYCQKI